MSQAVQNQIKRLEERINQLTKMAHEQALELAWLKNRTESPLLRDLELRVQTLESKRKPGRPKEDETN